jgi:hypothetical protein
MSEANKKQVGGTHYQNEGIPPHWDIVAALGWDYFVATCTKYLWRLGKKHPSLQGQLEDLDKAAHYLAKKRELLVAEIQQEREAGPQPHGYVDQDQHPVNRVKRRAVVMARALEIDPECWKTIASNKTRQYREDMLGRRKTSLARAEKEVRS